MHFLESMGRQSNNKSLCVKEFSKFLTDRAYTWYASLKPSMVHDLLHFVSHFNSKFFHTEARYTLSNLDGLGSTPMMILTLH